MIPYSTCIYIYIYTYLHYPWLRPYFLGTSRSYCSHHFPFLWVSEQLSHSWANIFSHLSAEPNSSGYHWDPPTNSFFEAHLDPRWTSRSRRWTSVFSRFGCYFSKMGWDAKSHSVWWLVMWGQLPGRSSPNPWLSKAWKAWTFCEKCIVTSATSELRKKGPWLFSGFVEGYCPVVWGI